MPSYSILLLGTQMAVGGAQKLLLEQALWFQAHGHRVTVLFFYDRDNLHEKWTKTHPFEIQNLAAFDKQAGGLRSLPRLLNGLLKLWRVLRRGNFDAVITFTHDSNLLGLPLARLAGVRARIGTHLGEIRGMSKWRERMHTLLVNRGVIQTLVASSARTKNNAVQVGVNPQKITTIYNAIMPFDVAQVDREAARQALGLKTDDIFLVSVGRLVYEKGHEFLVDAMSLVSREDPRAIAGICGAGPLREQLQRQVESLGLQGRVKLLGQWDSIPELLAASDVFVLPSRWEGLPMALLEGMMAGLPVIAARVEGVDEVVRPGEHGLLVPLESPAELAQAILQLLRSPADRRRMGRAARERVLSSYTTDRMCEAYLQVIEKGMGEEKA
ncbi:MAG: glycosyltransferase family 4 protein [Anaerolineales bacterium]|jgi:glycosyltransferase involved in cell wall biosynthesis|nr:glycosyltransferase family 4 protein [Chloroflexota bacterium]MBK6644706.1 glycosyltransferase family 4 protein [Anaerolineales bacterium]